MSTPLLMLGPGGDYTTSVNVRGTDLCVAPASRDPAPRRRSLGRRQREADDSARPRASSPEPRPREVDSFCLTAPLHAASAWLEAQHQTLGDFADQLDGLRRDLQTHLQPSSALPASPTVAATTAAPGTPTTAAHQPAFVVALRRAKARLRGSVAVPASAARPALVASASPVAAAASLPPRAVVLPVAAPLRHATLTPASPLNLPRSRSLTHEPDPQTAGHPQPHPRNASDPRLLADHAGARRRAGRLQGHRLRTRRSPDQKRSAAAAGQQSPLFGSLA